MYAQKLMSEARYRNRIEDHLKRTEKKTDEIRTAEKAKMAWIVRCVCVCVCVLAVCAEKDLYRTAEF